LIEKKRREAPRVSKGQSRRFFFHIRKHVRAVGGMDKEKGFPGYSSGRGGKSLRKGKKN